MKICPVCAHANNQASIYCEACGAVLDTDPSFSNLTERSAGSEPIGSIPPPPPYMTRYGPLSPVTPASPPGAGYLPPTQPASYTPYTQQSIGVQPGYQQAEVRASQSRTRTPGKMIINSFLYLWGIFCSAFGASGLLLHGFSSTLIGSVFLGYTLIGVIILVLILILRKRLVLRTVVRILSIVGITAGGGFLALLFAGILSGPQHAAALSIVLGLIFVLYGIAVSIVAVL